MKRWITLSHSARPLDFSRSDRISLVERFARTDRLSCLPSFRSLDDTTAPHWANNLTLWTWNGRRDDLQLTAFVQRSYTINHAYLDINQDRLVVCAHDALEICGRQGAIRERASHPWFAGGHTVEANADGDYVVACSASDSVLTVDYESLDITNTWRVPCTLYPTNYDLTLRDDVRAHYIPTDMQISHLNSASPTTTHVVLTCFIQGSIVKLFPDGTILELVKGHTGCHGGRTSGDGRTYFSDSPQGQIVWLDAVGHTLMTVDLQTAWLHGAIELSESRYACAVGDANELRVIDPTSGTTVHAVDLSSYGATPCLLGAGRM